MALRAAGPAQSDLLYHFCGRPAGTGISPHLAPDIAAMTPAARLAKILWDGMLRGSIPYGASDRMVCFSESPFDHLLWLLQGRGFPAWALVFTRQWVYNFGGGPVWYPREEQYFRLTPAQRNWAVRLDAHHSDWLHEREWRIPVLPQYSGLAIQPLAILVSEPRWAPWKQVDVQTGWMIDSDGQPGDNPLGQPEIRRQWQLPELWLSAHRWLWDGNTLQTLPPQT